MRTAHGLLTSVGVCVSGEDRTWSVMPVDVLVSNEDLTWLLTFVRVPISGEDSLSHQSTSVLYFNSALHYDAFEKATVNGRIMSRT